MTELITITVVYVRVLDSCEEFLSLVHTYMMTSLCYNVMTSHDVIKILLRPHNVPKTLLGRRDIVTMLS